MFPPLPPASLDIYGYDRCLSSCKHHHFLYLITQGIRIIQTRHMKKANKPDMSGIPQTTWPNVKGSAEYEIRIHHQNHCMHWLRRTPVEHVLPLNRRGEGVARVGSGGLRIVVVLVVVVLSHTHPVPGHLPDPRAGSEKSQLAVLSRSSQGPLKGWQSHSDPEQARLHS